jgi:hypothetical protein
LILEQLQRLLTTGAYEGFDYFPFFFNLSQLPFSRHKFAHILGTNDLKQARAVLDVGCGPGSNAPRAQFWSSARTHLAWAATPHPTRNIRRA